MIKWEKELQVRERRIRQQLIRPVEDAEGILFIGEKDIVLIADLVVLQNWDNQVGVIDIELLMGKKVSIDKNFILYGLIF